MSESVLLKSILEVSDYDKRAAKCDVTLLTLDEELQSVEAQLNDLMLNDPDFTESDDFKKLTRNKARLMKESKALGSYKVELAELLAAQNLPVLQPPVSGSPGGDTAAPIYHPPNLSSSESMYGSFPSPQPLPSYPTMPFPNQLANTSSAYTLPGQPQVGLSYPHQVSHHSPSHGQEVPVSSTYQAVASGRDVYPKPTHSRASYPAQESFSHAPLANSTIDHSSILPQWQMAPSMAVSQPTSQAPPYPPPRYQNTNFNNSNTMGFAPQSSYANAPSGIAAPSSYAMGYNPYAPQDALVFGGAGLNTPVAQEHGSPHMPEGHNTGHMRDPAHPSPLSRPSSAPVMPGQGAFAG
jgi:hypothetical protein